MKFTINDIIKILFSVAVGGIISCSEPDELENNGIHYISVTDEIDYSHIPEATITIYENFDDWANEINPIEVVQTDMNGEVVLKGYMNEQYLFDVRKGNKNNWPGPFSQINYLGLVVIHNIVLSENISEIISSAEGVSWGITSIVDTEGEDVSTNPEYACLLDDTFTFYKSNLLIKNSGTYKCSSETVSTIEGYWLQSGDDIYLNLVNETYDFGISYSSEDSFEGIMTIDYYPYYGVKFVFQKIK